MKETIGNVLLNLDYYDGEDAYSDGSIEDRLLEIGQYLMSFGCTSYHLEELVIHHRLYDACFLEVFSMKDTVGFFDMNSTVTYE